MPERPTSPAAPDRAPIRTPDHRLRVFVSSTLEELAAERSAARAAIERLRLAPVMFELGARPHPPRDLYRAYLEQSHVFVGIYWQRYGWVAPGEQESGLEDEYRRSGSHPRLIYLKKPAPEREPRLAALLDRIQAEDAVSYRHFTTSEELRELIQDDLAVLLTERFEQVARPSGRGLPVWAHTNMPVPRNPLIGREGELAAVCSLLRQGEASLVTLTGPGGCGKSRLALEVALELLGQFRDGVFLVALEAIRDPSLVIPAIADALHVREAPDRAALDELVDRLHEAHLLLLLDNFEQVVAAGPTISTLLERCPQLQILATSRTPLRIRGERRLAVPPLAVPAAAHADLNSLSQYAAVALFVERARGVQPGFAVTSANAPVIAELCHRLDGLPLAIELAAARLRLLAPADLLARLARRFDVLRGGTRDLPERQQTLRRTIDWSHDLLDEREKGAFRRLAVFSGGATLEAAEAVSSSVDDPDADPLDVIARLLDDSMLTSSIGDLGDLRIGMLDTMREYAAERLRESGELEQAQRRHAEWFRALVERAEPDLIGPQEPVWAARLQAERANLRAALEWSLAHDTELGLRIAGPTWRFWESHGSIAEAYDWLARLVVQPAADSTVRAKALNAAAAFACYLGRFPAARAHVEEAAAMSERLGDRRGVARALNEMGIIASFEGSYPEARRWLEAALAIKRELGDPLLLGNALANLGLTASYEGDLAGAEALHRESLTLYREHHDHVGVALATGNLAHVAGQQGRLEEALAGQVEALRLFHEIGDRDGTAESLERLAMVACMVGDQARAVRLFGHAATVREQAGTRPGAFERAEVERALGVARAGVDPAVFQSEWQAGRAMTVEEAVALVAVLDPAGSQRGAV